MSNLTEKAIQETFMKFLNERPLDKITVREITDACGISRNTFYYHYHDIYDLLEKLFAVEEERMLADMQDIATMRQGFNEAMRFANENRRAIYHVYNSISRDMLTSYLYNSASIYIRKYVVGQCDKDNMPSERDLNDLVFLYASMIEGIIINVMREGLTRDVEALINNATRILDGTVRLALDNCKI